MAAETIYHNQRIGLLWLVSIICLSTSIVVSYATLSMQPETDLYDYSSIWSMRLWQGIFLLSGNLLTFTLCWLSGKYVLKIMIREDGTLEIRTWSLFRITSTYHLSPQSLSRGGPVQHSGVTNIPGRPMVLAPWDSIRTISGQRFVIDTQGSFPEGYARYHREMCKYTT